MNDARRAERTWLNGLLFVLTILTVFFAGLVNSASKPTLGGIFDPDHFGLAALYTAVLTIILVGHELGHYLTCRRYGLRATLPFFLPGPPFLGTFGAFIRIKSYIPFRRQIFDVGANGPLTGFFLSLPALAIGLACSKTVPLVDGAGYTLGDPLLLRLLTPLFFGPVPAGSALALHPVGFAGWVGLLVTAINLVPLGQLDGGHIAYAILGRKARLLSFVMIGFFAVMGVFFHVTWLILAGLVLFFEFRSKLRLNHPRVLDESAPLGRKRWFLSAAIVLIFVLSFIPDPVKGASLIDILNGAWGRP
ncbi:MAG TPA: site-2 protease family protein [Acidobacteriota bacterium]|nr:site-2 protease family protein [Acidobacteriota bacterium]